MSLAPGDRIGVYELIAKIGQGGMGEVYRARDPRLGRDIAIKVLPADLAGSADRRARFEREARAIAALSHPNILALHDISIERDRLFIVTELLDGETLAERLRVGPLPVRKAVEIAIAVARGLSAAHGKGIAHRDLKPANIFLLADGQVKILDFGLAHEISLATGRTETHAPLTDPGTVMGTAGYMAPEQVRAQPVDGRADLFALGAVLYEMLTGQRAFGRDTAAETMSAILNDDPGVISVIRPDVPSGLERIVHHALEKNPAERFQTSRDIAFALDAFSGSAPVAVLVSNSVSPAKGRGIFAFALSIAAIAGALLTIAVSSSILPQRTYGRLQPFAVEDGVESDPAWSPDGTGLAYIAEVDGRLQIFTRFLTRPTPTQLTNLPSDAALPQWDDAGQRILFLSGGALWSVSAAGGDPQRLFENVRRYAMIVGQNSLVLQKSTTPILAPVFEFVADDIATADLWLANVNGGPLQPFALPGQAADMTAQGGYFAISISPRAESLLIGAMDSYGMVPHAMSIVAANGKQSPRRLSISLPPSHAERTSFAQLRWFGDERRLLAQLVRGDTGERSLWVLDTRTGDIDRLYEAIDSAYAAVVRPGDGAVAFVSSAFDWNILEIDLSSRALRPLISGARYDGWPAWLPDGKALLYTSTRYGRTAIWQHDLATRSERLVVSTNDFSDGLTYALAHSEVSPDGKRVAYQRFGPRTQIFISSLAGSAPIPLTRSGAAREDSPTWSPDGRWIAFAKNGRVLKSRSEGGDDGIEIARDFSTSTRGKQQGVRWAPNDDRIAYESNDGLMEVSSQGGPSRRITEIPLETWNWTPDARHILAIPSSPDRAMVLVRIDVQTGAVEKIADLGRQAVTPDSVFYPDTLRGLQLSRDSKRIVLAQISPRSDIWILDGLRPPSTIWQRMIQLFNREP